MSAQHGFTETKASTRPSLAAERMRRHRRRRRDGLRCLVIELRNDFENFLAGPTPLHVLGLYDSSGDYTPDNTQWMTRAVQLRSCRW